jgi:hypothetical protein
MPRKTTSDSRGPELAVPPTCERLWTIQEVSAFLGVPVATLHQWRYLGPVPAPSAAPTSRRFSACSGMHPRP